MLALDLTPGLGIMPSNISSNVCFVYSGGTMNSSSLSLRSSILVTSRDSTTFPSIVVEDFSVFCLISTDRGLIRASHCVNIPWNEP